MSRDRTLRPRFTFSRLAAGLAKATPSCAIKDYAWAGRSAKSSPAFTVLASPGSGAYQIDEESLVGIVLDIRHRSVAFRRRR